MVTTFNPLWLAAQIWGHAGWLGAIEKGKLTLLFFCNIGLPLFKYLKFYYSRVGRFQRTQICGPDRIICKIDQCASSGSLFFWCIICCTLNLNNQFFLAEQLGGNSKFESMVRRTFDANGIFNILHNPVWWHLFCCCTTVWNQFLSWIIYGVAKM